VYLVDSVAFPPVTVKNRYFNLGDTPLDAAECSSFIKRGNTVYPHYMLPTRERSADRLQILSEERPSLVLVGEERPSLVLREVAQNF
jgi:hypothetical protein